MATQLVNKEDLLTNLPGEWPQDLLPEIQHQVKASRRKVVVLDDDPTGTVAQGLQLVIPVTLLMD